MPSKKSHEIIAENMQAAKAGKELPHKTLTPEEQKRKRELDQAKRQAEIMDPQGADVELSFGTLKLYPMNMEAQSAALSFRNGILADALGAGARTPAEGALRISSILLQTGNRAQLLQLTASATFQPGTIVPVETLNDQVAYLRTVCSPDDCAKLFEEVSDRAQVKPPKKT